MIKKILFCLAVVSAVFIGIDRASAASFTLTPERENFAIDEDFTVDLKIDSEGVGVNAAQGTVQFPADILEVKSVDRTGSVFNFWLQEPSFSNQQGTISFIGGSTSGFSGRSLQVMKIVFHVKGAGTAPVTVVDGAITASDGSGTNVLIGGQGIEIVSSARAFPVTTITPIVREPTISGVLPEKPQITVPLYPDPAGWYNISSRFLVQWKLPSDIVNVSTMLDKNPESTPTKGEGLFDNKTFDAIGNGIWYLHVQFKNNVGWGEVTHYRIAIDTTPPLPFTVDFSSGPSSSNPAPIASFSTSDNPSGVDGYSVQIGDADPIPTMEGTLKLPLQAPAKHVVRVIARDRAGNTTDTTSEIEILPIVSPIIDFVTRSVFVGEGGLEARGTSTSGNSITVSVRNMSGELISSVVVPVDTRGSWFAKIDDPLKRGDFYIDVVAKDERGAVSLPVKSDVITARSKPIVTLAGLGITPAALFVIIVLVLIGGFVAGWFSQRSAKEQRQRNIIIAKRDITNVFNILKNDLAAAITAEDKAVEGKVHETKYHLNKVKKDMEKMEKYVVEVVEDIEKKK